MKKFKGFTLFRIHIKNVLINTFRVSYNPDSWPGYNITLLQFQWFNISPMLSFLEIEQTFKYTKTLPQTRKPRKITYFFRIGIKEACDWHSSSKGKTDLWYFTLDFLFKNRVKILVKSKFIPFVADEEWAKRTFGK
jgi:hypothetical protein